MVYISDPLAFFATAAFSQLLKKTIIIILSIYFCNDKHEKRRIQRERFALQEICSFYVFYYNSVSCCVFSGEEKT